ncbi:hypothetical protein [Thermomonas sp.]|uniref:hypothetical protein n=1 Tax=Thermomonas sp. TaxID=1971895 RepID=UPI001ED25AD7|nr:hypothetical protein [Thermomonas sp.]MBK6415470.1 hypothetical protein [Thermomonas sp.]
MRSHRNARPVPSRLTLALCALLAGASLPAMAADPSCQVWDPVTSTWVDDPAAGTDQGSEGGSNNTTCAIGASAFGLLNNASGFSSSAFGTSNTARNDLSNAFGAYNLASGDRSSAFGAFNSASGYRSSVFGFSAGFGRGPWPTQTTAHLDGPRRHHRCLQRNLQRLRLGCAGVRAYSNRSSAVGVDNIVTGSSGSAFGFGNYAWENSSAFGYGNKATDLNNSAFGYRNTTASEDSSAFGYGNTADGASSSAFGYGNAANGASSSAFGKGSQALNFGSTAFGYENMASGYGSTAFGFLNTPPPSHLNWRKVLTAARSDRYRLP